MRRALFTLFSLITAPILIISHALAADLTILHINDHHSHLRADRGVDLVLGGEKTRVRSGGFPALSAKFKALESKNANVLKLHAGDAITGDLYYTLFKGEADAALMNHVCFDAFALGNHEFDDGDAGLAHFLDFLNQGDCNTAVLAANIIPVVGVFPLPPNSATDYFVQHKIFDLDDGRIGIIGLDIATKKKQSSSPDATTRFADELATARAQIAALQSQGIILERLTPKRKKATSVRDG